MTSWRGKTRGGVIGYKIFISILKKLGLPFAYFILKFIVLYFILTSPKSNKYIFLYFRKILNYSYFHSLKMVIKNYYIFGQILLDKIALLSGFATEFTFDF